MRGMTMPMLLFMPWVWASCTVALAAVDTFMLSQDSAADTKGIRNRPMAFQLKGRLKIAVGLGCWPRFMPRKRRFTSIIWLQPSTVPLRAALTASQFSWDRKVRAICL